MLFDAPRRPTRHRDGYFGYRIAYDARGRESERRYVDANGQPLRAATLGHYGVRYIRDLFADPVEEHSLDADGNTLGGRALARVAYRYYRDVEIERRYLDGEGRPARAPLTGCSIYRTEHDDTLRVVAESCLDGQEQPFIRRDEG